MKKILMILLSVMILALAGCADREDNAEMDVAVNDISTEVIQPTEEETTEFIEAEIEEETNTTESFSDISTDESVVPEDETDISNTVKFEDSPAEVTQAESTQSRQKSAEEEQTSAEAAQKQEPQKDSQSSSEQITDCEQDSKQPEQTTSEPESQEAEVPDEEQPKQSVSYDPNQVVALATEKTKALGKISIPEDLDNMLANGEITKEEYDAYYPYDGAGYYSVFVETDLNEASTTSGRKLESVEGIADYISGMLALETGPYFYIEYTGITNTGGRDFYEFRCYRA